MKALVVDDTKNIRMLLTTCLVLEGYEVMTAGDGEQALNTFLSNPPDLAFLDIKLPRLSGTEVLRKVREQGLNTPIIIMTAFATVKNAVDCTKLGAVAYLQKPFTAEKVRSILKEVRELQVTDKKDALQQSKAFMAGGQWAEAYSVLKKALMESPSNGEIYFLLSEVYQGLGNEVEAERFGKIAEQFTVDSKTD